MDFFDRIKNPAKYTKRSTSNVYNTKSTKDGQSIIFTCKFFEAIINESSIKIINIEKNIDLHTSDFECYIGYVKNVHKALVKEIHTFKWCSALFLENPPSKNIDITIADDDSITIVFSKNGDYKFGPYTQYHLTRGETVRDIDIYSTHHKVPYSTHKVPHELQQELTDYAWGIFKKIKLGQQHG